MFHSITVKKKRLCCLVLNVRTYIRSDTGLVSGDNIIMVEQRSSSVFSGAIQAVAELDNRKNSSNISGNYANTKNSSSE